MKSLTLLLIALSLTSCAVQKHYGASGGSKADGTVKMSYTYGLFQKVTVSESDAVVNATARCRAWGYNNATAFDFTERKCIQYSNDMGCVAWMVTKEFQCSN